MKKKSIIAFGLKKIFETIKILHLSIFPNFLKLQCFLHSIVCEHFLVRSMTEKIKNLEKKRHHFSTYC